MRRFLLASLILFSVSPLWGEAKHIDLTASHMTGDQAFVSAVIQRAPELRRLESNWLQARSAYQAAGGASGPQIALSAGESVTGTVQTGTSGRGGQVVLTLQQSLYNSRVNSGVEQAELAVASAEQKLNQGRQDVTGKAWMAYWNAVAADERVRLAQEDVESYQALERSTQKRAELGVATNFDVVRAATARAKAQSAYESARENQRQASAALETLAGRPWKVNDDLEVLDSSLSLGEGQITANRDAAALGLKSAQAGLKAVQNEGMPSLGLHGSYTVAQWGDGDMSRGRGNRWSLDLQVTVPLLQPGRGDALSAAKLALEGARVTDDAAEQQDKNALATARSAFDSATRQLTLAKDALAMAQESLRLAQVGFDEGVNSQADWLNAKAEVVQARNVLIGARLQHAQAWADAEAAMQTLSASLAVAE